MKSSNDEDKDDDQNVWTVIFIFSIGFFLTLCMELSYDHGQGGWVMLFTAAFITIGIRLSQGKKIF